MPFTDQETAACQRLVDWAWKEDLGDGSDITTQLVIPPKLPGRAVFVARADGVVAGLPATALALATAHTPLLQFQPVVEDGTRVAPGQRLATITGLMEFILTGERIALNFLQHMSGIATLTRRYVDAIAGLPCKILDTRKTTPGWRLLEKYAVRCGGGLNHRMGLCDGILVKDNHLAALGTDKAAFVELSKRILSFRGERNAPLEIEIDSLEQLDWAFVISPDIILLDNMTPEQMREAVRRRDKACSSAHVEGLAGMVLRTETGEFVARLGRPDFEASGGVTLENVRAIADTGVDRISVGALTHSAPALDIGLDYEKP
jgi:nicotinate-nucleotide pyrophosphorylase (carboxylating)